MVLFDGVVLAIVGCSCALGLWRGFTREILSLMSWGIAAWVTLCFLPTVTPLTHHLIHHPLWALMCTAAALFLISLILLLFLSDGLLSWIHSSFLRGVDHVLGCAFGVGRGVLLVFLLYWGGCFFLSAPQLASFSQGALTSEWIEQYVDVLKENLQRRATFQELLAHLKEKINPLLDDPAWNIGEASQAIPSLPEKKAHSASPPEETKEIINIS